MAQKTAYTKYIHRETSCYSYCVILSDLFVTHYHEENISTDFEFLKIKIVRPDKMSIIYHLD